jgi:TrmH family RNA methyltransferase
MGSSFRLPLWTNVEFPEILKWCAAHGIRTVSTDLAAPLAHTDLAWTGAYAVIMGEEAGGLSPADVQAADERIRIPMRPPVEALTLPSPSRWCCMKRRGRELWLEAQGNKFSFPFSLFPVST